MTIHFLHHGFPLCDFTRETPNKWPHSHKWAAVGNEEVLKHPGMCTRCRLAAEAIGGALAFRKEPQ